MIWYIYNIISIIVKLYFFFFFFFKDQYYNCISIYWHSLENWLVINLNIGNYSWHFILFFLSILKREGQSSTICLYADCINMKKEKKTLFDHFSALLMRDSIVELCTAHYSYVLLHHQCQCHRKLGRTRETDGSDKTNTG